jgi:hypothetical protein
VKEVSCSDGSLAVGEPMAGTAPYAVSWMALEQNGPWGARAFTDSHLDPTVGRTIEDSATAHHVRPALIRRPGPHADPAPAPAAGPHVLVAHTRPGRTWLLEGTVGGPEDLLATDWAALHDGDLKRVRRSLPSLRPSQRPHLLVCTNAKRDVCCAVKGRPVALGVDTGFPGQVWEVTHTSGHRFAPTAVLLPAGILHGRLDVAAAGELLRAAARGATVLDGSRGRSTWPAAAQAADLAVREREQVLALDALEVVGHEQADGRSWVTTVQHVDGRSWRVRVEARESAVSRAESCGKALRPMAWFAEIVDATAGSVR